MADRITKSFVQEHVESINRDYGTDFKLYSIPKQLTFDNGQNWFTGNNYRELYLFLCGVQRGMIIQKQKGTVSHMFA